MALLTPAYVLASDSSSRFALDQEWEIQRTHQEKLDARFKAIEAAAAKAIAAFERKAGVSKDKPIDLK